MYDHLSILLVDDDAVDRMAVRRALRTAGIPSTVEEATDRDSALSALACTTFDVVLLDYRLPGSDGLTVLREMRDRGFSTPIIMLTGQGDEQLAVEMLRAGATDYLPKGMVSPDVLSQSISRALRVHRAERLAAQAEQALRVAAERQQFLAEASQYFVESLDLQTILDRLVELATRKLADGCAVDMLGEDGMITRVAVRVRDGDDQGREALLRATAAQSPQAPFGPPQVIESGQPLLYSAVDNVQDGEPEHGFLQPFVAACVRSMMVVPLRVRGQTLGAMTLISDASGRQYGEDDLMLAEDLAHRAAIALDNARLYREAQEAVRMRDAFLSVAAHELKTPLTTLYGNVQLLQRRAQREGNVSERDQRTLRIVFEQAGRLNRMITALLDLSRLQMGQFTIQKAPVDVVALTQRVVDELLPSLDRHTVTLAGELDPLFVMGDELRLEQVLQNLIQNGVKYSPDGGNVTVTIERTEQGALIAVSDAGIGIPQNSIPNLFRRFFRASNVQEHRISGIGVGLYVVHEIVTLHDGTISVESTEGVGTTFTVFLPFGDSDELHETVGAGTGGDAGA